MKKIIDSEVHSLKRITNYVYNIANYLYSMNLDE